MKWETIKKRVASGVRKMILTCPGTFPEEVVRDLIGSDFAALKRGIPIHDINQVYAEAAYDRIMEWDIRGIGKLRDLFPRFFPGTLQRSELRCYIMDDPDGTWMVEAKGK